MAIEPCPGVHLEWEEREPTLMLKLEEVLPYMGLSLTPDDAELVEQLVRYTIEEFVARQTVDLVAVVPDQAERSEPCLSE